MGASVVVDAGFLIALLGQRDTHHTWAVAQAERWPPPWKTCDSALSEAFHILGRQGSRQLGELLRRGSVIPAFDLRADIPRITALMDKYNSQPIGLADACIVRMTELLGDATVLTTDADFRVYRRHGRQIIPCVLPNA
jgi:predicted nucleic acid-binding protein